MFENDCHASCPASDPRRIGSIDTLPWPLWPSLQARDLIQSFASGLFLVNIVFATNTVVAGLKTLQDVQSNFAVAHCSIPWLASSYWCRTNTGGKSSDCQAD